jgi:hypothetical protein
LLYDWVLAIKPSCQFVPIDFSAFNFARFLQAIGESDLRALGKICLDAEIILLSLGIDFRIRIVNVCSHHLSVSCFNLRLSRLIRLLSFRVHAERERLILEQAGLPL